MNHQKWIFISVLRKKIWILVFLFLGLGTRNVQKIVIAFAHSSKLWPSVDNWLAIDDLSHR